MTLITGSLWILAPIAGGLCGLVGLLSLSTNPVFAATVVLSVVLARRVFGSAPLEREIWRLRPRG
jgi:hypothetical protein